MSPKVSTCPKEQGPALWEPTAFQVFADARADSSRLIEMHCHTGSTCAAARVCAQGSATQLIPLAHGAPSTASYWCCSLPQPDRRADNGPTSGKISLATLPAAPRQSSEKEDKRVEWKWCFDIKSVPSLSACFIPWICQQWQSPSFTSVLDRREYDQRTLGMQLFWFPSSQAFIVTTVLRSQLKRPRCLNRCERLTADIRILSSASSFFFCLKCILPIASCSDQMHAEQLVLEAFELHSLTGKVNTASGCLRRAQHVLLTCQTNVPATTYTSALWGQVPLCLAFWLIFWNDMSIYCL